MLLFFETSFQLSPGLYERSSFAKYRLLQSFHRQKTMSLFRDWEYFSAIDLNTFHIYQIRSFMEYCSHIWRELQLFKKCFHDYSWKGWYSGWCPNAGYSLGWGLVPTLFLLYVNDLLSFISNLIYSSMTMTIHDCILHASVQ